ncbi:hypothetical protein [Bradyrhizobium sp. Ec3.3]|nr:hypothetical protein [Bradyrhizobium sp. Ec3.3]
MITRRTTLAGLALLSLSPAARAEPGNDAMTRYAAEVSGKRPAVILLHGSRGIELRRRAYERYADALSAKGIDAYLLRYMTEHDTATLTSKTSTKASRETFET